MKADAQVKATIPNLSSSSIQKQLQQFVLGVCPRADVIGLVSYYTMSKRCVYFDEECCGKQILVVNYTVGLLLVVPGLWKLPTMITSWIYIYFYYIRISIQTINTFLIIFTILITTSAKITHTITTTTPTKSILIWPLNANIINRNRVQNKNRNLLLKYTMIQAGHNEHQQIQISDGELRLSINNINEIMSRINQAVKRTHVHLAQEQYQFNTFVTQENLITENVQPEQTDFVNRSKIRSHGMKIPLHQLHRKNKLSTVVQESQSLSGRTNKRTLTPREFQTPIGSIIKQENIDYSFTKPLVPVGSFSHSPYDTEDGVKSKKITGIRKTSNFKGGQTQKQEKCEEKTQEKIKVEEFKEKQKKYIKTKSMINIRCDIFDYKRDSNAYDCQTECGKKKSKSKNKKGLSLLSKNSLKSQDDRPLKNVQNSTLNEKKSKACTQTSSETKPKSSKTIQIKRRAINPFILSKQSVQLDKKKDSRIKNCLSRTNIRDFFVSKRINKKQE